MADLIATADLASYLSSAAAPLTFSTQEAITAALCCTAASDAVKNTANRTFEIQGSASDRFFTYKRPYGTYSYYSNYYGSIDWSVVYPSLFSTAMPPTMLAVSDFFLTGQTIGNITVSDTLSTSTYTPTGAWPFNAAADGLPYEKLVFAQGTFLPLGEGQLKVNAKWGYVTAIPAGIKEVALLQAARFFKRKDAPFGVAGVDAMGNAMRLQAKLDPDVEALLGNYRRWWAIA